MKLLLSLSLLLSFNVFADDHDSQESEWNVAEYYVSVFKDGKAKFKKDIKKIKQKTYNNFHVDCYQTYKHIFI